MDENRAAFGRGALIGGAAVLALAWIPMLSDPATGQEPAPQRAAPHIVSVAPAPWRPAPEGDYPLIRAWSDGVVEVNYVATKPIRSTTGQILAPCSALNPCLDDAWVQLTARGVKEGRRTPASDG